MANVSVSTLQPQTVTILSGGERVSSESTAPKDKKGFGFGDFIDMINPLHHIPGVGQVYRAITGDTISDNARLAGGGLYAGPLGIGIAAGTIAMRDNRASEAAATQTAQDGAVRVPINDGIGPERKASLPTDFDAYHKIAAQHWTPASLAPLAASLQSTMGQELKTPAQERKEAAETLAPVPTPQVKTAPLKNAKPEMNAQMWAQMLSNLEKYEAMNAAKP
ncbi:MAG: hypothetical protein AAF337_00430 [Pseudomonadota bacterium]